MEELYQLGMQEHELLMRQMVEEILRDHLNIGQAAAKFEVTRQTVKHWLDKLECEAATGSDQAQTNPPKLSRNNKRKSPQPAAPSIAQVEELKARMVSLEEELEASNFKALYYSTLVRIAEQELGIDIEKKSGTGSPRPGNPVHASELSKHSYPPFRGIAWF